MRVALCAGAASRDALASAIAAWLPTGSPVWRAPGSAVEGAFALVSSDVDAAPRALAELGDALRAFARAGGAVLGVGAGAALLCEVGLLPGTVVAATAGPDAETH